MAKRKKRRTPVVVKAEYDSAQTTDNNINRWGHTDALSANSANSREVRHKLIHRSRYECANNTYASGIIETLAQDCVGTGPRLQMSGDGDVFKSIESDWKKWVKVVGLNKKLLVMRGTKARDGEIIGLKVNRRDQNHPVKLYLQLFEAEQVQSHQSKNDPVDGIRTDRYGDPTSYRFLEQHPGDLYGYNMKGNWVPASQVIHYAYTTRPAQVRGIPEITPALELFVQLRAYTLSVLACAETAANLSAIMYTDSGAEEPDEVDPQLKWDIERNTLKALPFGWKLAQFKPEQPTTAYKDFKDAIINEIARVLHMPFNIAAGNSAGYNYSSGRLDHARYYKSIDVERDLMNHVVCDNLFADWIKEWGKVNAVDVDALDLSHTWQYDAPEHVDPVKSANAQKIRIETGISNLSIESAKEGKDWEEVMLQRAQEKKRQSEINSKLGLDEGDNEREE